MISKFSVIGAVLGLFLISGLATNANAVGIEDSSREFIQQVADQAIQSLTAKDVSKSERVTRFRVLFNDSFAVKSIGKFVLGRHWRKATDGEKTEYLGLFEDLMVISYVDRFSNYAGEALSLNNARKENERTVTVFSEIKRPGGAKPIRVDWRVGTDGKIYKILDVVVEGTSMSSTLRSDFGSIVRQNNGKVSGLIEELRKKTDSLKAETQN